MIFAGAATALAPAQATAAPLSDYLWQSRPLLVFAPSESDPRLSETVRRIAATRCDFADRDMVLGLILTDGPSTLDGRSLDNKQAQQLFTQFGIDAGGFSVVLIGKDGGEKLRVDDVPDLPAIYALIDGMPMRVREMNTDPRRC